MPESKWILRSRQVWQWILIGLFALAALDAVTLDAILPNVGSVFGLEPATVAAIRTKLLALAPSIALVLKVWRVKRPDDRDLTVVPQPVKDLVSRDAAPAFALLVLTLGAAPLFGCVQLESFLGLHPSAVAEVQQPGAKLFAAGVEYGALLNYVAAYRASPVHDPAVLAQIESIDGRVEEQRLALREAIAAGQPADTAQLLAAIAELRTTLATAGALPPAGGH